MSVNLNLLGMSFQAVGLFLAAIRDLTKHNAEKADGKIRETVYVEIYEAAKNGVEYEESTQEVISRRLAEFAQIFDGLLPYSIAIAALGTLMQIVEEISK